LISTNNFIIDLILAANEIDKLTALDKNRLPKRAATAMRELREQVESQPPATVRTPLLKFGPRQSRSEGTNRQVTAVLLNAAAMIRPKVRDRPVACGGSANFGCLFLFRSG
jgi:hypothetical protein